MAFPIGFAISQPKEDCTENTVPVVQQPTVPRKSVVQVRFGDNGLQYSYYNDQFDLHCGDMVYVDGKMEGRLGRVASVNYNFKIRISDYKRVIAVLDTEVHGSFYMAGAYFLTFDPAALSAPKVSLWFKPPAKEADEFVSGSDDTTFSLHDLTEMEITHAIAERGHTYYKEHRVRYISFDGTRGYAIVSGTQIYEVEFTYQNGEIGNLTCDCFCSYDCKHEVAVMIQLRELLEQIEDQYAEQYEQSGYFAAIAKETLFRFVIADRETGELVL